MFNQKSNVLSNGLEKYMIFYVREELGFYW